MDNTNIYQNRENLISINCLYYVGGYYTYEVIVSTNGYSGICSFCISEENVETYCNKINSMSETLSGEITIKDGEGDSYLKFYFDSPLKMYVCGQLGDSWNDNMLKFKMQADQTVLYELIKRLMNH